MCNILSAVITRIYIPSQTTILFMIYLHSRPKMAVFSGQILYGLLISFQVGLGKAFILVPRPCSPPKVLFSPHPTSVLRDCIQRTAN